MIASATGVDGDEIIRLEGATKSFGARGGQVFPALRGVSLRVVSGDFIAVLGNRAAANRPYSI